MGNFDDVILKVLDLRGLSILDSPKVFVACLADFSESQWRRENVLMARNCDKRLLSIFSDCRIVDESSARLACANAVYLLRDEYCLAPEYAVEISEALTKAICSYRGIGDVDGKASDFVVPDQLLPPVRWGPERESFTLESRPSHPSFNSIVDNPTIGDERSFVQVARIGREKTELKSTGIEIEAGNQYLVYIYVHNNASPEYNDKAHGNKAVSWKTKLSCSFSDVIEPGRPCAITAVVSSENSTPKAIWCEVPLFTQKQVVNLHYVLGSAKIRSNWKANGAILPSALFTEEGTALGLNELNGVIPGGEDYHCVVTCVLQAEAF